MPMKMDRVPVDRVFLDIRTPTTASGSYEFTVDCGAVYFGAVYDDDGTLIAIDQYFYSDSYSRDDMEGSVCNSELLSVDDRDFPTKVYLLTKAEPNAEWLRFHAIVPEEINPEYFYQKYIGE